MRQLLSGLLLVAVLTLNACTGAYRVTAVTTKTVTTALLAWESYCQSGKATVEQRKAVLDAAIKYEAALAVSKAAVNQWLVDQSQPFPQRAVDTVKACSAEVVRLVDLFQK